MWFISRAFSPQHELTTCFVLWIRTNTCMHACMYDAVCMYVFCMYVRACAFVQMPTEPLLFEASFLDNLTLGKKYVSAKAM